MTERTIRIYSNAKKEERPRGAIGTMKNTQLYPFERNKYYYGMLLSVEDFNAEQRYMNDKRRLINRLVHGMGVVCGLNVVRLDDRTVSVESGMALDNTGREIIVDVPVTKKLQMINGYESAMNSGSNAYVYLCLEYSEGERGAAYGISDAEGKEPHGKIRENYNLYLTSSEPDDSIDRVRDICEQTVTVFSSDQLCIRHITPRYVNPTMPFELRVEVETFTKQFAAFSYDIQLVCLNSEQDSSPVLSVKFNEMLFDKSGKYTLVYKLRSTNVTDTAGTLKADPSTFTLAFDKVPTAGSLSGTSSVSIIDGSIEDAAIRAGYERDMDSMLRSTMSHRLYLARIDLVNAGDTAVIEDIVNVPFRQYVAGGVMLSAMHRLHREGVDTGSEQAPESKPSAIPKASDKEVASGVCRIDLSSGSLKNKVFCSEEITHGLGLGSVTILLGINTPDKKTVYGDPQIFKDSCPQLSLAAKTDPSRGSFVIGVMTSQTVLDDFVEVKWTAIRDADEAVSEKNNMKIMIKPNSLIIKPRENRYLEAVCVNMTNKTVRWSVVPETGGSVDHNGLYTAPAVEGVYEVVALSAAYPEVKASIMVVVRE
ncbi:MAG: hypothetical protein IKP95_02195 [Ruminococcus sp.]|nr:hypothetical protein [Ruminococcus sp.]